MMGHLRSGEAEEGSCARESRSGHFAISAGEGNGGCRNIHPTRLRACRPFGADGRVVCLIPGARAPGYVSAAPSGLSNVGWVLGHPPLGSCVREARSGYFAISAGEGDGGCGNIHPTRLCGGLGPRLRGDDRGGGGMGIRRCTDSGIGVWRVRGACVFVGENTACRSPFRDGGGGRKWWL